MSSSSVVNEGLVQPQQRQSLVRRRPPVVDQLAVEVTSRRDGFV
jgi:hypothetical protein